MIVLTICVIAGVVWNNQSEPKLSGTYRTTEPYSLVQSKFVFDDGYCQIGDYTCTYQYKNGILYFFWGDELWESYRCTINGNKIIIRVGERIITYYKQ